MDPKFKHAHFRIVKRSTVTGRVLKVIYDSEHLRTEADVASFLDGFGRSTDSWKTTIVSEFVLTPPRPRRRRR